MDALYDKTVGMINELDRCFRQLEKCPEDKYLIAENDLKSRLDEIENNCQSLDIMVNRQPQSKRSSSRLRVDQLKYDSKHYVASLRAFSHRRIAREEEKREREELMAKTFSTNDGDTSIMIDQSLCQNRSLHSAHQGMDEMLGTGTSVLENLREQKGTLKTAHRKILDIANTLGLSNTVMRLIEKRTYYDKFILIVGMLVTILIMFLIVKYFTSIL